MVVFKSYSNFGIYLIGSKNENELILAEVIDTLNAVLESIFTESVEKSGIVQFMTVFLLVVDEVIDNG